MNTIDLHYWDGVITSPAACFWYITLTLFLGLVMIELLRSGHVSGARKRAPRMIADRLNALRRGAGYHSVDQR